MKTEIEQNWDQMAHAYEDFTEGEDSYSYQIEWPCIQKMMPELAGKKVLDLGCGTGRFTFLLEEEKASLVIGVDLSANMLEMAKEKAAKRNSKAEFQKGDLLDLKKYIDGKYDFIFSSTTTHYIKDLPKLFHEMYDILEDNGSAILSVMHPVYTAQYPIADGGRFPEDEEWVVRYLDKRERAYIQPWIEYNHEIPNYLSTSYHFTISDYVNALLGAGFTLDRLEEPDPPEEWKESQSGRYDGFIETPSYLILKISKR